MQHGFFSDSVKEICLFKMTIVRKVRAVYCRLQLRCDFESFHVFALASLQCFNFPFHRLYAYGYLSLFGFAVHVLALCLCDSSCTFVLGSVF